MIKMYSAATMFQKREALADMRELLATFFLMAPKEILHEKESPKPIEVTIYTDGACRNNQAVTKEVTKGASAFYIELPHGCFGFAYATSETTNNQRELAAMIEAIKAVVHCSKFFPIKATIISDSEYVVKGVNEWLPSWKAKAYNKVKNHIMWQNLDLWLSETKKCKCEPKIKHCKGHAQIEGNERADLLCNKAIDLHENNYDIVVAGLPVQTYLVVQTNEPTEFLKIVKNK